MSLVRGGGLRQDLLKPELFAHMSHLEKPCVGEKPNDLSYDLDICCRVTTLIRVAFVDVGFAHHL